MENTKVLYARQEDRKKLISSNRLYKFRKSLDI